MKIQSICKTLTVVILLLLSFKVQASDLNGYSVSTQTTISSLSSLTNTTSVNFDVCSLLEVRARSKEYQMDQYEDAGKYSKAAIVCLELDVLVEKGVSRCPDSAYFSEYVPTGGALDEECEMLQFLASLYR